MNEPLDELFRDDRIKEVLLHFERVVVERFLENYIEGVR